MFKRSKFLSGLYLDHLYIEQVSDIKPGSQIVSLNLEQFVLASQNPDLMRVFADAELIIPDGAAIVLTDKYLLGHKDTRRIAGIDLAEKLIQTKNRIALLGSTEEVIETLKKKFSEKIVFAHHGFFQSNDLEAIKSKIFSSEADLLLVALGSPKQELLIYSLKPNLPNTVMMGVGGTFDVWSGRLKRAPKIFQDLNLEWLFRLIQEPYRSKRLLYSVPKYIFLLIREMIKG